MSFVSQRPSMFPQAKPRETLRSRGHKTHCFPRDQSFSYTPQLRTRKNWKEIVCFTPAGSQICHVFKEHDLITCKSKVHVFFPRELVSFVRPWKLVSFDLRHVTRSSLIKKRIKLGGLTRVLILLSKCFSLVFPYNF